MTPVEPRATPGPHPSEAGVQPPDPASRARVFRAIVKVIEVRLRFIALMTATALVFGYWDTLANLLEKRARRPGVARPAVARDEHYCPMHPSVIRKDPAQCPNCGMPLARRARGLPAALPPGVLSRVHLEAGQVARAGIRTVEVRFATAPERLTAVGFVRLDESRRVLVASDARGRLRVDRTYVNSVGESVGAGQRLADLYGYDVSQAIRVFLEAERARRAPKEAATDPGRTPLGDPEDRVQLAVEALKVLGVRQEQIAAIAGDASRGDLLPLLAPCDGQITRSAAVRGQYVAEGEVLFEVADLSRVWVEARIFEDDLGRIEPGQPAEVTVPAYPGMVFAGKVGLTAPALDPSTRTGTVRLAVDNRDLRLRPEMFADVALRVSTRGATARVPATCPVTGVPLGSMGPAVRVDLEGRTVEVCCAGCIPKLRAEPGKYLAPRDRLEEACLLSVPDSAVIDTGRHRVVYVECGPGVFEGRAVTLGPRRGNLYPVIEGLAPGERVAVAGAFLIDAETRIDPTTSNTPPAITIDRSVGSADPGVE